MVPEHSGVLHVAANVCVLFLLAAVGAAPLPDEVRPDMERRPPPVRNERAESAEKVVSIVINARSEYVTSLCVSCSIYSLVIEIENVWGRSRDRSLSDGSGSRSHGRSRGFPAGAGSASGSVRAVQPRVYGLVGSGQL